MLIAYGSDDDSGMWSKAMRIRGEVPSLTAVLRVAPHDEPAGSARRRCPRAWPTSTPRAHANRTTAWSAAATSRRTDIAAYFHTGGTTGAPKLARHSHGAQVFTAWASVQLQGMAATDVTINGYPLFHVAGVLPASLAALSAGVETIIPTPSLLRNREVLANYWRLVEKYRPTTLIGGADGARGAGQRAAGRRRHLVDPLLPHRRGAAAARTRPRASSACSACTCTRAWA